MLNKIVSSFKAKKIRTKILIIILVFAIFIGAFTLFDNFRVDIEVYSITSDKFSNEINGYKIAHVSDYHNRASDLVNNSIIESLEEESPDIIVFTGDAVDSKKPDFNQATSFMEILQNIAQVYFVTGNHEYRLSISHSDDYLGFINDIENIGVVVLDGQSVKLQTPGGEYINLYGISDPYFTGCEAWKISDATDRLCSELTIEDGYNILLAHHPEQMDVYADYGFDLVLSGHAHGGQVTFFGFPIKAPDQSGFLEYSDGLYEEKDTKMIISRGIGYSVIPLRFFCSSQLVYVEFNI